MDLPLYNIRRDCNHNNAVCNVYLSEDTKNIATVQCSLVRL